MIKPMVLAGILLVVGMALGEETIAHWDFSRGTIDSVDGKIKMHFRGHTRLEGSEGKQFLNVGINNKDRPEGIIAKEKYPQLTPKGAFRLEIKARLRAQTGTTPLVLWDTHYHLNPKNPEQDKNKGFCFYLVRNKDGRFRPQAAFGFATSLDMAYGELVELEENQNFTIALEYDGELVRGVLHVDPHETGAGQHPAQPCSCKGRGVVYFAGLLHHPGGHRKVHSV